jgi:hypothetical protein
MIALPYAADRVRYELRFTYPVLNGGIWQRTEDRDKKISTAQESLALGTFEVMPEE